jgi:hypothetical protein
MILPVGKSHDRGCSHTLLHLYRPTKDGDVKHLLLPGDVLARAVLGFEPIQLFGRDQLRNPKGFIVECKADDVSNDTKERVVI